MFNVTVCALAEGFLVKPDYHGGGPAWPKAKYVADAYQIGVVVQDMLATMTSISERNATRAETEMAKYAAQGCLTPLA